MKIGLVHLAVNNAHYRAVWPVGGLQVRGHEVVTAVQDLDGRLDMRSIQGCDVVFVYRARSPHLAKVLMRLRKQGAAIVYDNDDDHRLMPEGTRGRKGEVGYAGNRAYQFQAQVLRQADVLTTTSAPLAERFANDFDGHVEVLENFLAPVQLVDYRPKHDGIVIGWVAAGEHYADARMLRLTDVLRRVMERDPRVRVETVGVKLDLDSPRYTHTLAVAFASLTRHVSRWDIGIAPIADIPMSYVRSNVKVKEYAAAGLPWLASDRGPYTSLGRGRGGILVADDAWEDALLDLAGSRIRRRLLRRQAQAWAKTQLLENHQDRWEAVMELAVELAARQLV